MTQYPNPPNLLSVPILQSVLEETKNRINRGLPQNIVFDLDSTLFDVTRRSQTILEEFIESEHLDDSNPLKQQLRLVKMELRDHGLEPAMKRSGIVMVDESLRKKLIEFWRARFFSDKYLELDVPFEGASEYVNRLYDLGAFIYYLTGRDWIRMGEGTPRELLRWNFPLDKERVKLIMKPQKGQEDAEFKLLELQKLEAVHWFFENEPKIIHRVEASLPNLRIVFFDSSHSGKAHPKPEWLSIKGYRG